MSSRIMEWRDYSTHTVIQRDIPVPCEVCEEKPKKPIIPLWVQSVRLYWEGEQLEVCWACAGELMR